MNGSGGDGPWSQAEPFGQITANPQDDFSDFLTYENMDMDFSNLESMDSSGEIVQQHLRPAMPADALRYRRLDGAEDGGALDPSQQQQQQQSQQAQFQGDMRFQQSHFDGMQAVQMQQPQPGMMTIPDAQQQQQQQYRGHYSIPPTPNSMKMHPNATPGYVLEGDPRSHPMAGMHVRPNQQRQSDLTPQISPDIGTSDTAFSYVPEFIAPSYLSPLTSPAINPQNAGSKVPGHSQSGTASASDSVSPAPMVLDPADDAAEKMEDRPRKSRRKEPTPRSSGTLGATNKRPSETALNRSRRQNSTSLKARSKSNAVKQTEQNQSTPAMSSTSSQSESPQAVQDVPSMAPPPRPGSTTLTPDLVAQATGLAQMQNAANGIPPATPASLMRMPPSARSAAAKDRPHSTSHSGDESGSAIDDLRLPESATPTRNTSAPLPPRLVTNVSYQSGGGVSSPYLDGSMASPGPGARSESRSGRTAKKRTSTNQSLVSPALRPKISPSIKPLLPGDGSGISNDTHALLLASKSNYQNILEGNTLPGVNYPSELSTNLTSKRTSHKIAEQGRRNRINMALQEMQTLLPPPALRKSVSGEADEAPSPSLDPKTPRTPGAAAAATSAGSKAATVEQAIDHIKYLQSDNRAKDEELAKLREENAALQARLSG